MKFLLLFALAVAHDDVPTSAPTSALCYARAVLDFATNETFMAGTILDDPITVGAGITMAHGPEFTGGVTVRALSDGLLDIPPPIGNAAMIFDAECDGVNMLVAPREIRRMTSCRRDQDLYSPGQGNVLIISEDLGFPPDDAANGGNLTIDFTGFGPGVFTVESLKLVDFEEFGQDIASSFGLITITADGLEFEIDVGEFIRDNNITIENGDLFELPINLAGVSKLEIDLNDVSGSLDDIIICDPVTAEPTATPLPSPAPTVTSIPTPAPTFESACPDEKFKQLLWPWIFYGNTFPLGSGLVCEDLDYHTDFCAVFSLPCTYGPYELDYILHHYSQHSYQSWKRIFKIATVALLNICAPYKYPYDYDELQAFVYSADQRDWDVPEEEYIIYKIANNGIDCEDVDPLKCPLEGCPPDEWKHIADYGCDEADQNSNVCDIFGLSCGYYSSYNWIEYLTVGEVIQGNFYNDYKKRKLQIFVAAYLNICSDKVYYPYSLDALLSTVQEIHSHNWWGNHNHMEPAYEPFEDANDNLHCPDYLGPRYPTLAPTVAPDDPEGCPPYTYYCLSDLGCAGVTPYTRYCEVFGITCNSNNQRYDYVHQVLGYPDYTYYGWWHYTNTYMKHTLTAYLNACRDDVNYIYTTDHVTTTVQNQNWNNICWEDYDHYYWQNQCGNCPI